jgi:sugar/nucleoside kinase (ribokinase family)
VLVVGTIAYDSIQTPYGEAARVLGGSASYFAVAASFFSRIHMVGVIGDDFEGRDMDLFQSRGIDLTGVERCRGKTFAWSGRYHEDMNVRDTVKLELNVLEGFRPLLSAEHRDAKVVFLGNIDPGIQLAVLDQVGHPELVAGDTMNHWIAEKPGELKRVIQRLTILMVNDEEARMMTGQRNLVQAARKILDMGPEMVLIKRGEYGVLKFTRSSVFAAPAYPLEEVFDPTGAGDAFAGGFIGYLARSEGSRQPREFRRAIIYGSVLASFAVENFGLKRMETLSSREIETRFSEFIKLTDFQTDRPD